MKNKFDKGWFPESFVTVWLILMIWLTDRAKRCYNSCLVDPNLSEGLVKAIAVGALDCVSPHIRCKGGRTNSIFSIIQRAGELGS